MAFFNNLHELAGGKADELAVCEGGRSALVVLVQNAHIHVMIIIMVAPVEKVVLVVKAVPVVKAEMVPMVNLIRLPLFLEVV